MYLDGRDFQTVWQLAHNWVNADPNKSDPNTLSFELVEAIHRLLSAIVIRAIAARTRRISILDNDSIGTVIFDSIHHIKINTCLRKDRFDKDYLDSIYVKRSDVLNWCDRERIVPPALWAPENPAIKQVAGAADDPDDDQDGWYEKLTEQRRRKVVCVELAKQLWQTSPGFTYKEMHEHPDMKRLGYSSRFSLETFKVLVRSVASEPARLGGRPFKSKP